MPQDKAPVASVRVVASRVRVPENSKNRRIWASTSQLYTKAADIGGNSSLSTSIATPKSDSSREAGPELKAQHKSNKLGDDLVETGMTNESSRQFSNKEPSKSTTTREENRDGSSSVSQRASLGTPAASSTFRVSPRLSSGDVIFVGRQPALDQIERSSNRVQNGFPLGGNPLNGVFAWPQPAAAEVGTYRSTVRKMHSAPEAAVVSSHTMLVPGATFARVASNKLISPGLIPHNAAAWPPVAEAAVNGYQSKFRTLPSPRERAAVGSYGFNGASSRSAHTRAPANGWNPWASQGRVPRTTGAGQWRHKGENGMAPESWKQSVGEVEELGSFAEGTRRNAHYKGSEYVGNPAAAALSAVLSEIIAKGQRGQ